MTSRWFHRRTLRRAQVSLAGFIMVALAATMPCQAQDYSAGDWISFEPGTNIQMEYYQFASPRKLDNTISGDVPQSHLNSHIGIARFMHYDKSRS